MLLVTGIILHLTLLFTVSTVLHHEPVHTTRYHHHLDAKFSPPSSALIAFSQPIHTFTSLCPACHPLARNCDPDSAVELRLCSRELGFWLAEPRMGEAEAKDLKYSIYSLDTEDRILCKSIVCHAGN